MIKPDPVLIQLHAVGKICDGKVGWVNMCTRTVGNVEVSFDEDCRYLRFSKSFTAASTCFAWSIPPAFSTILMLSASFWLNVPSPELVAAIFAGFFFSTLR